MKTVWKWILGIVIVLVVVAALVGVLRDDAKLSHDDLCSEIPALNQQVT